MDIASPLLAEVFVLGFAAYGAGWVIVHADAMHWFRSWIFQKFGYSSVMADLVTCIPCSSFWAMVILWLVSGAGSWLTALAAWGLIAFVEMWRPEE